MILSVIIPSYKEPFLKKTTESLLKNSALDDQLEIIPVLDGYIDDVVDDQRVKVIKFDKNLGMRKAINAGLIKAKGKFIMKCDAHCIFGEGFDKIITDNCAENWLIVPRRYSLNAENWKREMIHPMRDYHFLNFPISKEGQVCSMVAVSWFQRTWELKNNPKYEIDNLMTFQGSCWMANREYFMKHIGFLDDRIETYGNFAQEPQEIGLKYWLGGGKVKVIKKTWYAHLSKRLLHYQKKMFDREYKQTLDTDRQLIWSAKHWLNNEELNMIHPFSWLIEKFWPVPGWETNWQEIWAKAIKL